MNDYKNILLAEISARNNLSKEETTDLDDYMTIIGGDYWVNICAPQIKQNWWQKIKPKLKKGLIVILLIICALLFAPGIAFYIKQLKSNQTV